jgi:chromosome segregation ATPase
VAAKKRAANARKVGTSRPIKAVKSANRGGSGKSAKSGKPAASGRIAQLEAMVQKLRANLVAEAQRRKLDQRVLSEARKARDGVARQLSALRAEGLKVAAQLKRAAQDNHTLESARRAALVKIEELRAELHDKGEEVRRTSAELAKLARESAARAKEIVHNRGLGLVTHHDPDVEGVHDDDLFGDDPFPGEKPPV